jgi:hypothetical protein
MLTNLPSGCHRPNPTPAHTRQLSPPLPHLDEFPHLTSGDTSEFSADVVATNVPSAPVFLGPFV